MEQIQTIDSIKKCKQNSKTLSLQETDDAFGVRGSLCSVFLCSSGLLAQGEYVNPKSDQRNAVVTFRDPKTGKLKGRDFFCCCILFFRCLLFH